jgi:TonB family protein
MLVIGLHIAGIWLVSVYGGLGVLAEKAAATLKLVAVPVADPVVKPPPPVERARLLEPRLDVAPPPVDAIRDPPPLGGGEISGPGVETMIEGAGARVEPPLPPTPLGWREARPIDDFYPPVSIRMGEEGATVVRACVDAAGALQRSPEVQSSSGHSRLDSAAVAWTREALVFTPATRNGARIPSCKEFRVRFRLR